MKRFGTICFYLFAIGISAYAVYAYAFMPLGARVPPAMKLNFLAHKGGIYTHVFAASLALVLSPFQFSSRLRRTRPRLHRILGRAYLGIGVTLGGLSGLYMATLAQGGAPAKTGFAALALAWLFTGWRSYQTIRRGAVNEHRAWVTRNVSLTLAAVTLRFYIPASILAGIPFDLAYPVIAWLCWVPNLIVAELVFIGAPEQKLKPSPLREAAWLAEIARDSYPGERNVRGLTGSLRVARCLTLSPLPERGEVGARATLRTRDKATRAG